MHKKVIYKAVLRKKKKKISMDLLTTHNSKIFCAKQPIVWNKILTQTFHDSKDQLFISYFQHTYVHDHVTKIHEIYDHKWQKQFTVTNDSYPVYIHENMIYFSYGTVYDIKTGECSSILDSKDINLIMSIAKLGDKLVGYTARCDGPEYDENWKEDLIIFDNKKIYHEKHLVSWEKSRGEEVNFNLSISDRKICVLSLYGGYIIDAYTMNNCIELGWDKGTFMLGKFLPQFRSDILFIVNKNDSCHNLLLYDIRSNTKKYLLATDTEHDIQNFVIDDELSFAYLSENVVHRYQII
jgi:hypothetical protein